MKYQFIEDNCTEFPVRKICRILVVTRSAYYSWIRRPESKRKRENEIILQKIKQIRLGNTKKEVYGSPRMKAEINELGINCSENRVARIMRNGGIFSRIKRKFKATTDSEHKQPIAGNLVKQNFTAEETDELWVTDITYLWTEEGWLYLAAVLDVFSRAIVGWAVSDRLTKELVLQSINNALVQRNPETGLIIHSDRGSQYASEKVRGIISKNGFKQSMSGVGNCYDNAMMESFFHSLKVEHIYFEKYSTRKEAKTSIFEYIELFYNRERRHSALGNMAPFEYEKRLKLAA